MSIWKFYLSGILYGELEDGDCIRHRRLDVYTGEFCPWEPVTAETGWYRELGHMDVAEALDTCAACEALLQKEPQAFTVGDRLRYVRRDERSYVQRDVSFPRDLIVEDGRVLAFVTPFRDQCAVLVRQGQEGKTILAEWQRLYPGPVAPVCPGRSAMVPMRDGIRLAADYFLPVGEGPFPAVLVRTPYGKKNGIAPYFRFVQRGYAVVLQDVRGREDSEGEWKPMYHEVEDGSDTLDWIAAQPWSDGSVAMTGGSYLGYVQWAAAASGNPHLKALLSSVCSGSPFVDIPRRGGCFNSGALAWAFAVSQKRTDPSMMVRDDWDQIMEIRPLRDLPQKALGCEIPFLTDWMDHRDYDEMWSMCNWRDRTKQVRVPALIMSGWFDDDGMGTTEALELCKGFADHKAVLGPWLHGGNSCYDLNGLALGTNALRYDMDILCLQWLEHYLRGVDNGVDRGPQVEYYTTGSNCWKQAQAWPVPDTVIRTLYLSSLQNGDAVRNQGLLSAACPVAAGENTYLYDPEDPAAHLVDLSQNELEMPADYAREEQRADVLCYTTDDLSEPLTVTGDLEVKLYLSSDCVDTDLVVRITDVDGEGHSWKLADGLISARYRNSFAKPELLEPGRIYPVTIRTTKLSHTFLPGHQLRLTVTSSAKNFIFPNRNMGEGYDGVACRKALNTIHHGSCYPSCLVFRQEL